MIRIEGYEVINVHLFKPAFKNVKQRCEVTTCNAAHKCDLYKSKKCLMSRGFFGGANVYCPHGNLRIEEGYTTRAKSYYSWFMKHKELYGEDKVDALDTKNTDKLCIVGGDYVYLPYSFLHNYVNKIEGIEKEKFIRKDIFNVEKVYEIFKFVPLTLFERQEIRSYQNKEVPKFVQHLKEVMPELYNEFINKYHEYRDIIEQKATNYIGRTAKVSTLKQGSKLCDCHKNCWVITDDKIVCENWKTWLPFGKTPTRTEIGITDDMTYKITDNDSVVEGVTVFID